MPTETEAQVGAGPQAGPGPRRLGDAAAQRPEEIVCISVDKVFDFCFQEEVVTRTLNVSLPMSTGVTGILDTRNAACQVIGEPRTGDGGLTNVTLRVTVPATVQIANQSPMTVNFVSFRTIQLNMPVGTSVDCDVTGTCFCGLIDVNGDSFSEELYCQANLCVVVETTARVKLLVPSYGFCAPVLVREAGPVTPPELAETQ